MVGLTSQLTRLPIKSNRYGMVGLTSQLTHSTSFPGRFYGSDDPTNDVTALKDNG